MKTAAIYTRLSTAKGENVSLQTQEADCRARARELGFKDVKVIEEAGRSASEFRNGERPEWSALLGRLDDYGAVIAWKQDRLARDELDWHTFVRAAGRAGVRIVTVADGTDIDPDNPDLLGPSVKAMVAAQQSRDTSIRVRRALAERRERGDAHSGGARCYGYTKAYEIVPEEAKTIRECAARILAGESLNALAIDLTARRVPTVGGGSWRRTTLRSILTRSVVNGRRTPTSPQRWPAILDDETVAEMRVRLTVGTRGPVSAPGRRLLRGFLVCGLCGRKLVGASRSQTGYPDYCCPRRADGGCGRIRIAAVGLEDWIRDVVIAAAATPATRLALEKRTDRRKELDGLSAEIRKLERVGEGMARDLGTGKLAARAYRVAIAANERAHEDLERQVASILSETDPILGEAPRDADALRAWWDAATEGERRGLINSLVERIDVGPGKRGNSRFQAPERATVTWRG